MQNIYISKYNKTYLDLPSITLACFSELDNTFYVSDKENNIHQLVYDPASQSATVGETIPADPQLAGSTIIQITYLIDSQSLCVVTAEGAIFKVTAKETELVAQNEDGIYAASWSPSQDRLLIITKNNTLLQLNEEFNLDNELPLNDSVEEGAGENSKISWKPDGKYCVINFGIQGTDSRKCLVRDNLLNVFKSAAKPDNDPKGLVQSVSENPVNGLLSPVSWNPTGNIIAGVDKIDGRTRVIFWEKNGLRHLEFPLQSWVREVNQLNYSHDGEILYVQVTTEEGTRQLLLYHRANYHWYLKSSLTLEREDRYVLFKERRNSLFVIGNNAFQFFQFSIKPNNWEWKSYQEEANSPSCLFYSIDSNRLLVSDYSKSIIPPPMCLKQLRTNSRILASSKLNNHILLISSQSIYLYDHLGFILSELAPNTITERLSNLKLLSVSPVAFLINRNKYSINGKQLQTQKNTEQRSNKQRIKLEESQADIEFELVNSQLFVNDSLLCQQVTSYCLYDVFLLFTTSTSELYQKLYVFNLLINTQIYEETSPTLLKKLEPNSLDMRNVERGSKIITCSQGRCIFQLPRGNLEGIYPKTITLLNVRRAIGHLDYLRAFELVRTHKLDMNLLFDLNPEQFIANGEKLLSDIKKVDYISLLIASLKEGVSDELKYCLEKQDAQKVEDYFQINKDKIKTVCGLVSTSLRSLGYQKYILAIMAAEVKSGELPKVLHEIKSIKSKDVVVKIPPHLTEEPKQKKLLNSKEILEYVCWMADPETVYKVAFLTFDLELVAMAAEFTQKDPKEYLPYLEELKAIENEVDRRARICLDLKQYTQAIKQLARGNEEQKGRAIGLVETHKLFKVGISAFGTQKQYLLKVRGLLGDHLVSKDQFAEAFNIFVASRLFEKALELSIKITDTLNIIDLMTHLEYPKEQIVKSIQEIAQRLGDSTGNSESLGAAYQYLGQWQQASKVYLRSENFTKLNRILKHLSPQYVESKVLDGYRFLHSLKHNQTLSEVKTFTEKYLRLQAVQKMKRLSVNLVIATKEGDEMYSEYSRVSGQSKSNYTVSTTTGMKKKKQKVKGILTRNVKQGSPLEEEYLVAILNDLIAKSSNTIKNNKILIQQLVYMDLLVEAESLKQQTKSYSQLISKRIRPYKEIKYQEENPDICGIYPPYEPRIADSLSSFDYII